MSGSVFFTTSSLTLSGSFGLALPFPLFPSTPCFTLDFWRHFWRQLWSFCAGDACRALGSVLSLLQQFLYSWHPQGRTSPLAKVLIKHIPTTFFFFFWKFLSKSLRNTANDEHFKMVISVIFHSFCPSPRAGQPEVAQDVFSTPAEVSVQGSAPRASRSGSRPQPELRGSDCCL